ncbi:hypothetical protein PR048_008302 [Dryococelus australis]|uniref:RNA-directed DNA polymerase n=1 Tax=Dryococelus australis TaxID=614101 RepID=A0ABQ9HWQ4_9NEOP|nr:hypothetical protein PR048_008302 [Dryococelus australis]
MPSVILKSDDLVHEKLENMWTLRMGQHCSVDSTSGLTNRKTTQLSTYVELDKAMLEWFNQKRAVGTPVSGLVRRIFFPTLNTVFHTLKQPAVCRTHWTVWEVCVCVTGDMQFALHVCFPSPGGEGGACCLATEKSILADSHLTIADWRRNVAWSDNNQRAEDLDNVPGESPSMQFVCETTKHQQWLLEVRDEHIAHQPYPRPIRWKTCRANVQDREAGVPESRLHVVSNGAPSHHTWRLSAMSSHNADRQIEVNTVVSKTYAAITAGQVEAGLVRKHYILPINTPVTAFTCPLQSEAFVVSGQWKPTQWYAYHEHQSSQQETALNCRQTGPHPLQCSSVKPTLWTRLYDLLRSCGQDGGPVPTRRCVQPSSIHWCPTYTTVIAACLTDHLAQFELAHMLIWCPLTSMRHIGTPFMVDGCSLTEHGITWTFLVTQKRVLLVKENLWESLCPKRVRDDMGREHVYHFQRRGERILQFQTSVSDHAGALNIYLEEENLVELLTDDLSPAVRTHSVGCYFPITLENFCKWAVQVENRVYISRLCERENDGSIIRSSESANALKNNEPRVVNRKYLKCQQERHIAKYCKQKRENRTWKEMNRKHRMKSIAVVGRQRENYKKLLVNIEAKGKRVAALIDTGASNYFISQQFVNSLVKENLELKRKLQRDEGFKLDLANGVTCNVTLMLQLHFKLSKYSWTKEFWVMPEQRDKLERLIGEFSDVITKRVGCCANVPYQVRVDDETPICLKPYQRSPPKKDNVIANCLSRIYDEGDYEAQSKQSGEEIAIRGKQCNVMIRTMPELFLDFSEWQKEDEECVEIKASIYLGKTSKYMLDKEGGGGAHMGKAKTKALIKQEFFWLNKIAEIDKFVRECQECQLAKQPQNSKVGHYSVKLSMRPWEKQILYVIPLRDMKANNVVKALVHRAWKVFGSPEQWGIKHVNTSPYYPCPNLVERLNKNVKVALHIFHNSDQHHWDTNLPELNITFNSAPHNTTGYAPSKVFLGREPSLPLLNVWGIPSESMEMLSGRELEELWQNADMSMSSMRVAHSLKELSGLSTLHMPHSGVQAAGRSGDISRYRMGNGARTCGRSTAMYGTLMDGLSSNNMGPLKLKYCIKFGGGPRKCVKCITLSGIKSLGLRKSTPLHLSANLRARVEAAVSSQLSAVGSPYQDQCRCTDQWHRPAQFPLASLIKEALSKHLHDTMPAMLVELYNFDGGGLMYYNHLCNSHAVIAPLLHFNPSMCLSGIPYQSLKKAEPSPYFILPSILWASWRNRTVPRARQTASLGARLLPSMLTLPADGNNMDLNLYLVEAHDATAFGRMVDSQEVHIQCKEVRPGRGSVYPDGIAIPAIASAQTTCGITPPELCSHTSTHSAHTGSPNFPSQAIHLHPHDRLNFITISYTSGQLASRLLATIVVRKIELPGRETLSFHLTLGFDSSRFRRGEMQAQDFFQLLSLDACQHAAQWRCTLYRRLHPIYERPELRGKLRYFSLNPRKKFRSTPEMAAPLWPHDVTICQPQDKVSELSSVCKDSLLSAACNTAHQLEACKTALLYLHKLRSLQKAHLLLHPLTARAALDIRGNPTPCTLNPFTEVNFRDSAVIHSHWRGAVWFTELCRGQSSQRVLVRKDTLKLLGFRWIHTPPTTSQYLTAHLHVRAWDVTEAAPPGLNVAEGITGLHLMHSRTGGFQSRRCREHCALERALKADTIEGDTIIKLLSGKLIWVRHPSEVELPNFCAVKPAWERCYGLDSRQRQYPDYVWYHPLWTTSLHIDPLVPFTQPQPGHPPPPP